MQQQQQDRYVGPGPCNETLAAVESPGYYWRAWHECRAFLHQLRRLFGPEPPCCRLHVRESHEKPGTRLNVTCAVLAEDKRGQAYVAQCVSGLPTHWDEEARAELGSDATAVTPPKKAAGPLSKPSGRKKKTRDR